MIKRLMPFIFFAGFTLGTQILVFITNIIIANNLTMNEFGIYSLIISVVNLLLTLCCQWHTSMVHYCGSKEIAEKGNMQQTNNMRFFLLLICYTVAGIILLVLNKPLTSYIGGKYVGVIYLLVMAKGISETITAYLIARKKRQFSAILLFVLELSTILILLTFKTKIEVVLLIQILSNASFLFLIPFTNKDDFNIRKKDNEFSRYCFQFAIWQLMGSIAIYIVSYGDNYIIKLFLSYDQIAEYNAAYKLFNSVFMASNIIASFYIANLTKALIDKDKNNLKLIFKKDRYILFGICAILHVILILCAEPIIHILYQGKYNSVVNIFRILMLASLVRYWTIFEMMYLNAVGRIKVQQYLNVLQAMIKIVLGFTLIKEIGLVGLAISTFISIFIVGLASFVCSERDIKKLYE